MDAARIGGSPVPCPHKPRVGLAGSSGDVDGIQPNCLLIQFSRKGRQNVPEEAGGRPPVENVQRGAGQGAGGGLEL